MIKIAKFQYPIFNPYNYATMEIYVSGCTRHCEECHNPLLQDFNYGDSLTTDNIIAFLNERKDLFDIIAFTGGDLLCQDNKEAYDLVQNVYKKFKDKSMWLFTGESNIKKIPLWCFKLFNTIKIGCYIPKLKQDKFPASSNQQILKKDIDY